MNIINNHLPITWEIAEKMALGSVLSMLYCPYSLVDTRRLSCSLQYTEHRYSEYQVCPTQSIQNRIDRWSSMTRLQTNPTGHSHTSIHRMDPINRPAITSILQVPPCPSLLILVMLWAIPTSPPPFSPFVSLKSMISTITYKYSVSRWIIR